ncbi:MAG: TIGR03545 family protein [Ignavibacteriales bacterium]|nr:TIGR03545 family protein [Ignavibacteriales bacterium]
MRKKFVYFILVPLVSLSVVVYLFVDRWVESGLESAGEAVVGARVEIDNLHLSLSPIAVQFSKLRVTNPKDPWKNMFETGKVRFSLDFGQLLRGKYIIETMEVNSLILGTKRTTDGSLPNPPPAPANHTSVVTELTSTLGNEAQKGPVFDLNKIRSELKIDSLLNVQNLRTVQYIDTLKLQVRDASQQWQTTLNDIEKSKQRLADIQTSINAINLNELKTLQNITAALNNVNNAYKGINDINETFKNRRAAVTTQLDRLTTSVKAIDSYARSDYEMVRRLARVPDLSTQGLAKLLLGRDILQKVGTYLSWIEFARTTVPKYVSKPDNEKPPRFKGQDVHFPDDRAYPKFWIKKIAVSGGEDKAQNPEYFYAKGEVRNITNNQRITGFPLTISLAGSKAGGRAFTFDASFDRRPDVPVDNYKVTASNLPAGDITFGQADFVPSRITRAIINSSAAVTVPGDHFDSNIKLAFRDLALVFDRDPRGDIERITRDVLAGITGFNVGLRLWNTSGPLDVALTTDLDEQLTARTKKVIGDEFAKLQNDIRTKVDQRIAEKRVEFEKMFNQKKDEALSQLKRYESLVNQNLALLDGKKKDLDARIEQEKKKQTDAAKKQIEDAVKGLFKKR